MDSLYGNYRQLKFTDVWDKATDFVTDFKDNGIPTMITEVSANTLYYLLYSRYGNSTVASSDIYRFKYNVFSVIYQYGATWEKRLEIQKKIRELTDTELFTGNTQIYNKALNPSTDPSTQTLEELTYINEQNTAKSKRGKLDAYAMQLSLLQTDVTGEFLDKFKRLFLTVVQPELPLWYISEGEEDGND